MAEPVSSNLSTLARQVEVERALVDAGIAVDSGVKLDGFDDTQTVSSNSDEHVTVWSTQDGEPHEILRLDARRALTKRVNGKQAFWIPEMGGAAPQRTRGDVKCYLDPEFDESQYFDGIDREFIDSIGLRGRTCNMMAPDKNNQRFASEYDRDAHAAAKHKREWATIQTAKARRREERYNTESRETRESMLALARSVAGRAPEAPAEAPAKAAPKAAKE